MKAKESKERILLVSEKLFAEKGYDAARVDEIAREAKVNKALIYYYFKNKAEIREALFESFRTDLLGLVDNSLDILTEFDQEGKFREFFDSYLDFFDQRKNVIRIMVMESLKESGNNLLFEFMDLMIQDEAQKLLNLMDAKGYNIRSNYDRIQGVVTDFFTGFMPILNFVIYKENWKNHYQMSEKEIRERFYTAFQYTHLAYHQTMIKELVTKK